MMSIKSKVIRKPRIAIILAFACAAGFSQTSAQQPPPNLARIVAGHETENAAARLNYTYRQSITIEDFDRRGRKGGVYQEVRDIIFSPEAGRTEQFIKGPHSSLRFLKLTEEDFQDVREVQPFLFTEDQLWAYETKYRGEEPVDGEPCYVLQVRPRQVFHGQRLFEGIFWIHKQELVVVRSAGKAVPPIFRSDSENLFPAFTTIRARIDGKHWFPVHTHADDTLPFRTGPLRMRMTIKYSNYQRFAAESSITFGDQAQ